MWKMLKNSTWFPIPDSPGWAPRWPHEPCYQQYQGRFPFWQSVEDCMQGKLVPWGNGHTACVALPPSSDYAGIDFSLCRFACRYLTGRLVSHGWAFIDINTMPASTTETAIPVAATPAAVMKATTIKIITQSPNHGGNTNNDNDSR